MRNFGSRNLWDMVFVAIITVFSMISVRFFFLHNSLSQENTPIFTSQEIQLSDSSKE